MVLSYRLRALCSRPVPRIPAVELALSDIAALTILLSRHLMLKHCRSRASEELELVLLCLRLHFSRSLWVVVNLALCQPLKYRHMHNIMPYLTVPVLYS